MFKVIRSLSAMVLLGTLLTGCVAQSTIANLTAILGTSAASIAALEGNPVLAAKLTTDTAAAVSAVQNWKSGTPAQVVIEALNIVEDDLNLIPGTSQYAPLVFLAIGTVESILALLPQTSPSDEGLSTTRTVTAHRSVVLTQPAPKSAKAFKAQWNNIVKANPSLAAAAIK